MLSIIDQALDTFYEKVIEMPNKVLDIFNNFFGEERVDMQGFPSKESILNHVSLTTIGRIFKGADMSDKMLSTEFDENDTIRDIDFDNISSESVDSLVEAILSNSFVELYKDTKEGGFILVHFPEVTVTNEYDRSTVVKNLYIKVPLTIRGGENGLFTMNRSEYTVAEVYSDYMHSHARYIPRNRPHEFVSCCLGSGPLNHTQATLSMGFDEDRWNIFCLELSKYVEVESIAGIPYHRLEKINFCTSVIGDIDRLSNYSNIAFPRYGTAPLRKIILEFLSYYIDHNDLTFSYRNGIYSIGVPYIEYLIKLSNSFIEYINSKQELPYNVLENSGIIGTYTIINGKLYNKGNEEEYINNYKEFAGEEICTFKGNPVVVTITDLERYENKEDNTTTLINVKIASKFLNNILRTINYRYGRNQENSDSTPSRIRYQV